MNSVMGLVNSAWTIHFVSCTVNSCAWIVKQYGLLFIHFEEKKKKANAELKMWIQTDTKVWFGLGLSMSAFYSFTFLPFFFFTRSWFHVGDRPTSGYRAQCTGPTSILDVHTLVWNGTVCGSYALFTGPTNIFFHPNFNYKWVPQYYSHI